MGTFKTKGIIISESKMGDYDKMLTILTPGMGKISCSAKGARKTKSLLLAGTQILTFGEYMIFKGNGTYSLNSCEIIEPFYNLRIDLDKLNLAAEITKIISLVTNENENSYKILQLFLNTLYMISETETDLKFIESVFKLRLMGIIGYLPNIRECINCKQKEEIKYFSIKDAGLKCETCGRQDKSAIQISPSTEVALKYIYTSPAKKLYSFKIPQQSINELNIISKLYNENIIKGT